MTDEKKKPEEELSDEQLDSVAGGMNPKGSSPSSNVTPSTPETPDSSPEERGILGGTVSGRNMKKKKKY